ncbi:MAG TPA: hypothetical protein VIS95_02450 [Solirubrobacterales bacterium]
MIEAVAEAGFAAVDVRTICERAQVGRANFDRCFADLEDCFLGVHDELLGQLCAKVEAAYNGRRAWHDRVWAAGLAAMRHLQEDPVRARFLVVAVNGAGSAAQLQRDRIVQLIADVLDGGRGESNGALNGKRRMSRCTAEIAAGAVYGTLLGKVESGSVERGEEFLPELIYLATMPYLGARAAEDELLVQPLR